MSSEWRAIYLTNRSIIVYFLSIGQLKLLEVGDLN